MGYSRNRYVRSKGSNRDGPEDVFRKSLQETAILRGCRLILIPDPKINKSDLTENNKVKFPFKFRRRYCDCVLIVPGSPGYNYFIELKAQSGSLTDNEKNNLLITEKLNKSYYVVRRNQRWLKSRDKFVTTYSIEKPGIWEKKIKFDNIWEIIDWFKDLTCKMQRR